MNLKELYNKYLDGYSFSMDIVPKPDKACIPLFIEFHDILKGQDNEINKTDLFRLLEKKEMKSDYFIFHFLGIIEQLSEEFIQPILKRLRTYNSDILTKSVLRNMHRIFGFDMFSKHLLKMLNEFSTAVELSSNISILMKYEYDIDHRRYEWIGTMYKIPLGLKSSFNVDADIEKDQKIQSFLEKRSSILLNIFLRIDGANELNDVFKYSMPRIEFTAQEDMKKRYLVMEKLKL